MEPLSFRDGQRVCVGHPVRGGCQCTGLDVARRGGFIQDEDRALAQQCAREAHELALADAEVFAAC